MTEDNEKIGQLFVHAFVHVCFPISDVITCYTFLVIIDKRYVGAVSVCALKPMPS